MRWSGPAAQLARVRHTLGPNTTTGSRKNAPVISSHKIPPTRPKGRSRPPTPFAIPRPVSTATRPACATACPFAALVSRVSALAWACGPRGAVAVAIPFQAIRPATRTPVPITRPMYSGFIPSMMVAAILLTSLCARAVYGGCLLGALAVTLKITIAASRAAFRAGRHLWR